MVEKKDKSRLQFKFSSVHLYLAEKMCLTFSRSGWFSLLLVAFERIFYVIGGISRFTEPQQARSHSCHSRVELEHPDGSLQLSQVPLWFDLMGHLNLCWNPFSVLPRRDFLLLLGNCVWRNTDSDCGSLTLIGWCLCVSLLLVSFYSS